MTTIWQDFSNSKYISDPRSAEFNISINFIQWKGDFGDFGGDFGQS